MTVSFTLEVSQPCGMTCRLGPVCCLRLAWLVIVVIERLF